MRRKREPDVQTPVGHEPGENAPPRALVRRVLGKDHDLLENTLDYRPAVLAASLVVNEFPEYRLVLRTQLRRGYQQDFQVLVPNEPRQRVEPGEKGCAGEVACRPPIDPGFLKARREELGRQVVHSATVVGLQRYQTARRGRAPRRTLV